MCSSYKIHDLLCSFYEVVSEISRTSIVVTFSVKEYKRGCQGHTSASILHQHVTPRCEDALFLRVFFQLRVSFCQRWMAKSSNVFAYKHMDSLCCCKI
jgi:hypothetical protein